MSAPSSMYRRRTFWPSGPVWWVFSCMPSIWPASSLTASTLLATLTPPPLPRPPAWICALTTHTAPPNCFAARAASSTVNAGMPRGVGIPYLRKISLPWYSWIFTASPCSLSRHSRRAQSCTRHSSAAHIPLRIVSADVFGRSFERVTAVELERLLVAFVLATQSGKSLHGCGRQRTQQLGDMRTTANAAHVVVQALAKSLHK